MANLNLSTVELVSTLRAAPQNGSPSSQDYNDSWTEALADLASLSGFVNDVLIPMLDGLSAAIMPNPTGTPNGLEGRYIFGDTSDLTPLFFDALAGQSLSIADSLRVVQGIATTLQTSINTLNVEVTALQSQLSSTNQNDIAQALQNLAAALQSVTAQTVSNTQAISNSALQILTDGTPNPVQNRLNIIGGTGITATNTPSTGDVTIAAVPVDFKTNGTDNSIQTLLNLAAGSNIGLVESAGTVTVAYTGPVPSGGLDLEVNGTPNGDQSLLNLAAGANITLTDNGIGTVTVAAVTQVGGTSVHTADYLLTGTDNGTLLQMNSASAHTFTLPAAPPSTKWFVILKNINTGVTAVSRNGLMIDGQATNLSLSQGDSVMIFTDGTNYLTGEARPFDIAIFAPALGINGQLLIRINLTRACVFPASAPNAQATASFAATGSTTYTFKKNGSSFATVNYASLATTGVYTQASDAVFVPGDLFEVDGPSTADATLSDVGLTLQGYRF